MSDPNFHRTIDADRHNGPVDTWIDSDGDVWFQNEDGNMLISLTQAFNLHRELGQMIAHFQRSWGLKLNDIKAVAND